MKRSPSKKSRVPPIEEEEEARQERSPKRSPSKKGRAVEEAEGEEEGAHIQRSPSKKGKPEENRSKEAAPARVPVLKTKQVPEYEGDVADWGRVQAEDSHSKYLGP